VFVLFQEYYCETIGGPRLRGDTYVKGGLVIYVCGILKYFIMLIYMRGYYRARPFLDSMSSKPISHGDKRFAY
jgi:hypothetical protein